MTTEMMSLYPFLEQLVTSVAYNTKRFSEEWKYNR